MAGKEFRTRDNHKRQRDAERSAHHQRANGGLKQVAESENQNNPEPDVRTRHRGADPETQRIICREASDAGGIRRALIDRVGKHSGYPKK